MKKQFFTVMSFEYTNYLRNKVFLGTTIVVVCLLAIGLSLPGVISFVKDKGLDFSFGGEEAEQVVYIIDETNLLSDASLFTAIDDNISWQFGTPDDLDDFKTKVDQAQAKGLLVLESPQNFVWLTKRIGLADGGLPMQIQALLTNYYRSLFLAGQGFDQEMIGEFLQEPSIEIKELAEESGKSMAQTYVYTYLLIFLLYMTVMTYGQLVATSVASEKSNRAMEMLITSAKPLNLMFGKVIGAGLAGLTQISVFLLTAAVFYKINESHLLPIAIINDIFEMPVAMVFFTILFYLTGYFAYAFLYGALGSLVSRIEDINTSVMPLMLLFMSAFFVSFYGMMSPESKFLEVASFLPFFSPMAMFVRVSMSHVPAWQITVSVALMLATIAFTGWLSAKIYHIGVLMYGKPPKWRELMKILRKAN